MRPKQYDARIEVRWPKWLVQWVDAAAKLEQRTLSNFVRVAVTDYLQRNYSDLRPTDAASEDKTAVPPRRHLAETSG